MKMQTHVQNTSDIKNSNNAYKKHDNHNTNDMHIHMHI